MASDQDTLVDHSHRGKKKKPGRFSMGLWGDSLLKSKASEIR